MGSERYSLPIRSGTFQNQPRSRGRDHERQHRRRRHRRGHGGQGPHGRMAERSVPVRPEPAARPARHGRRRLPAARRRGGTAVRLRAARHRLAGGGGGGRRRRGERRRREPPAPRDRRGAAGGRQARAVREAAVRHARGRPRHGGRGPCRRGGRRGRPRGLHLPSCPGARRDPGARRGRHARPGPARVRAVLDRLRRLARGAVLVAVRRRSRYRRTRRRRFAPDVRRRVPRR